MDQDLFGDSGTSPACSAQTLKRATINLAHGFVEFWQAWPAGPRKVAKKQCLDKWARYGCANEASLIVQHVEWMKTQADWLRDNGRYTPAPLVYLNQRRWEDWEPPAPKPPQPDVLAAIKAHKGTAPSAEIRAKMQQLRGRA